MKIQFFEKFYKKKFFKSFEDMNHMQKSVRFVESYWGKKKVRFFDFESFLSDKNSILWIIFKKEVQFFESDLEKGSILCVVSKKKGSILWVMRKKVHLFESCSKKKAHFCESYSNESSSLWVIFKKRERFNSFESW